MRLGNDRCSGDRACWALDFDSVSQKQTKGFRRSKGRGLAAIGGGFHDRRYMSRLSTGVVGFVPALRGHSPPCTTAKVLRITAAPQPRSGMRTRIDSPVAPRYPFP